MRDAIDRRAMAALSLGHFATDFAGGALPALLPFLVEEFDLSYTLAAALMLASALSSSLIQPALGAWSDRRGAFWLLPAGVAIGGVGMALASASPAYWLVLLFVTVSGLGTAAYHPEGSKFAAYASGRRRSTGMALFSIGGNLGYGLGALAATTLVVYLGLRGGLLIAVPCFLVAAILVAAAPYLKSFVPDRETREAHGGEDRPRALAILLAVVGFRSLAWFGLITFIPLWEVAQGHSKAYGNNLLTLMLVAGAVGTLLGGPLADRFGTRAVMLASSAVAAPLILVWLLVGGAAGIVALCVVGAAVVGTYGVSMVMAQQFLPRRIGTASGLVIGLSIGLGGVAAIALGAVADAVDLRTALYVSAAAPVVALALTFLLPTAHPRGLQPEVALP